MRQLTLLMSLKFMTTNLSLLVGKKQIYTIPRFFHQRKVSGENEQILVLHGVNCNRQETDLCSCTQAVTLLMKPSSLQGKWKTDWSETDNTPMANLILNNMQSNDIHT